MFIHISTNLKHAFVFKTFLTYLRTYMKHIYVEELSVTLVEGTNKSLWNAGLMNSLGGSLFSSGFK
jgi:hypothetical protein